MRSALLTVFAGATLFLLSACAPPEPEGRVGEEKTPATAEPATSSGGSGKGSGQTNATPSGGSGEGVGIISPAAGGMAPVTGSDSVTGAGGGVQSAAKDAAKNAASQVGAGSVGTDESGD